MQCLKCRTSNTQVIDSRDVDEKTIRRRRECQGCGFRFTTYERLEPVKLTVEKRSGKVEPFSREKIIKGVEIAAKDRIGIDYINDIADEIEQKLIEANEPSVSSKKIGNLIVARLKKIDQVSYMRFASVYKDFQNLDSFEQELEKLRK